MRKNKFSDINDEEFIKIISESTSTKQILLGVGYQSANGSGAYSIFSRECDKRNIEKPVYVQKTTIGDFSKKNKKQDNEVFIEKSTYTRCSLKKRIIKNKLIKYECSKCGLVDKWVGEKISLQLEHINGINDDNRLINLTFLCPNCHSQTNTYAGKKLKITHYCECGNEKNKYSKICSVCSSNKQRTVVRPSYEDLMKEIKELGYCGTGRKYGVSDNAVRNWKKCYCDCGNEKHRDSKMCSVCSSNKQRTVVRPSYEQLIIEIEETNYVQVGKKYGVSDNAIRKWMKNYEKMQLVVLLRKKHRLII
jgi:transposase-like protein/Zn finger protein HypA/HybF involved in hydrogenase expression